MISREWHRVTRENPCPICKKPDWCSVSDDNSAVICMRIPSHKQVGEAGCLHHLKKGSKKRRRPTRVIKSISRGAFDQQHKDYQADLQPQQVDWLSKQLGVSLDALRSFELGWKDDSSGFTFPIKFANEDICGIQIRTTDHGKFVVKGSMTRGLFVPTNLDPDRVCFVTEGVSDACALATLGFQAYARFSKATSPTIVNGLARHRELKHLVIVGDNDADEGGRQSAQRCAAYCKAFRKTQLLFPPTKDVRQWVRDGATRDDVINRIDR
jgi:hypothetical protein